MLENPKKTKDDIVQWIRDYFEKNGPTCNAVIGISGGKDSTVVAALCVEALGKDRVVGVLMPDGQQPDIEDSENVVDTLGIRSIYVDISDAIYGIQKELGEFTREYKYTTIKDFKLSNQAIVNMPPRIRMTTLYAVAQSLPGGGRVANTCNFSEDYVGYSTKFGDSAGDFSPLGSLVVSDVIQIGLELPVPKHLVLKTPSDGLCGKSDEENLGFTYDQLEKFIVTGTSGDYDADDKIANLHVKNLHKMNPIPTFPGRALKG